jgi:dihydroorotate dehydrogenase electron transfer subunit
MIKEDLTIVSNDQLSKNTWKLTLEGSAQLISGIKPGQFINIRITQRNDPFFRRPFSVFRCSKKDSGHSSLQVVYEVVGRGSEIMSRLERGDKIDVIGPLGNGFAWARNKKTHVVIGGGIGSAGIFMLCEELSEATNIDGTELYMILDVKTKNLLILEEEFNALNGNVLIATHDGSFGYNGYVTDMIRNYIESKRIPADCAIYACGPEQMYKDLVPVCQQYNISAQISIERNMMCGMGACMSCVCKVNKKNILKRRVLEASHVVIDEEKEFGYALVCRDGPVFYIDEVIFDEN